MATPTGAATATRPMHAVLKGDEMQVQVPSEVRGPLKLIGIVELPRTNGRVTSAAFDAAYKAADPEVKKVVIATKEKAKGARTAKIFVLDDGIDASLPEIFYSLDMPRPCEKLGLDNAQRVSFGIEGAEEIKKVQGTTFILGTDGHVWSSWNETADDRGYERGDLHDNEVLRAKDGHAFAILDGFPAQDEK